MEITEMTLEDLEQMKNTLYSDFDNFWSYNVLKQELVNDKTKYIIAKEKNEVVGFAGISVIFDEATLNNIVVKKSCRGKGIGGEMLETLIDLCSDMNLKTFTLEVNVENTPSYKLYEKFGFKNLGIRKKYYNNTTDAYIMTKYEHLKITVFKFKTVIFYYTNFSTFNIVLPLLVCPIISFYKESSFPLIVIISPSFICFVFFVST